MPLSGVYPLFNDRWCKQTVWLYSDPHFGDEDLRAGTPKRPSDKELVKMINSCVGRKDTIIFLGDISNIEYIKQIRGYKVLICGNHDSGCTNYERKVITQLFSKELYTKEQVLDLMKTMYPNCRYNIEERLQLGSFFEASADNMLFDEVYEGPLIIGEKLILSHEPISVPWAFNIHGHIHNLRHKNDDYHFNVCADAIGYKPINMNQLMKSGVLSKVASIHRQTIDQAVKRKQKRGGKKIGQK